MSRRSLLRLVDANANRALEGLRVCEDLVRFHWADERRFTRCRVLRHAVARAVAQLPMTAAD